MKILLLALFSFAAHASPETDRLTQAFLGKWVGEMTAHTPYGPPETVAYTMECRSVASGHGLNCDTFGHSPSVGDLTQSCLLAVDPGTWKIHYMCVSNMGEVHDHVGSWQGNKLQYEKYEGTANGAKVAEEISTEFLDADTFLHTTLMTGADGKMEFYFRAKRAK